MQTSVASGQRGWKRHPAGGADGSGVSPGRMMRVRARSRTGSRQGDRRQQRRRVGVQRGGEQRLPRGKFDDAAEIHHRHVATGMRDHAEVVADEQHAEAARPLQVAQAG